MNGFSPSELVTNVYSIHSSGFFVNKVRFCCLFHSKENDEGVKNGKINAAKSGNELERFRLAVSTETRFPGWFPDRALWAVAVVAGRRSAMRMRWLTDAGAAVSVSTERGAWPASQEPWAEVEGWAERISGQDSASGWKPDCFRYGCDRPQNPHFCCWSAD